MLRTVIASEFFRPWPGLSALLMVACSFGIQVSSAAGSDIYRVEEDWEMVVNEPDPSIHSPQVTFFRSPAGTELDRYFQFQLNNAVEHDFSGGGFHVAALEGSEHLDCERSTTYQPLVTHDQAVRWTNIMFVSDSNLFFGVKNGYCQDWGNFGGLNSMVQMGSYGVTNLNAYSPAQSVELVDIGFGSNRIASLVLKNVRLYYADGRVSEMSVNLSPQ